MYQTVSVLNVSQANKLAERLCRAGYWFMCQMAPHSAGRIFTFSETIDFRKDRKLFTSVEYQLHDNPKNTPTERYNIKEV